MENLSEVRRPISLGCYTDHAMVAINNSSGLAVTTENKQTRKHLTETTQHVITV